MVTALMPAVNFACPPEKNALHLDRWRRWLCKQALNQFCGLWGGQGDNPPIGSYQVARTRESLSPAISRYSCFASLAPL